MQLTVSIGSVHTSVQAQFGSVRFGSPKAMVVALLEKGLASMHKWLFEGLQACKWSPNHLADENAKAIPEVWMHLMSPSPFFVKGRASVWQGFQGPLTKEASTKAFEKNKTLVAKDRKSLKAFL